MNSCGHVYAIPISPKCSSPMLALLRRSPAPHSIARTLSRAMSSSSNISSASPQSPAPTFKPFTLALIQLGQVGSDKAVNLAHARDMIRRAAAGEVTGPATDTGNDNVSGKPDLIVLPECFNSPYGIDFFPEFAEEIGPFSRVASDVNASPSDSVRMLAAAAKEEGVWLIGGSIPERDVSDGKLYNTSTVYSPNGELVAMHRKVHLFDIDIPSRMTFKESATLTGGNSLNYFDTDFARVGLGICYDVRFPELTTIAARKGAQVCIFPGAFNTTTGPLHWELLQRARAVDNQIYFAMCSPARDVNADYQAWGHSMVVDPMGAKLVEADADEAIVQTRIDPDKLKEARAWIPVTTQRRFDVYSDVSK